jgi:hypothetical protein
VTNMKNKGAKLSLQAQKLPFGFIVFLNGSFFYNSFIKE